MDLQAIANQFASVTCVMSVEKKPDGGYGVIRIEAGNKAYEKTFLDAAGEGTSPEFVPGQNYEVYIPKDLNFEDFCYRAAVLKKPMHAYVHPERFPVWFNMVAIPLESDNPNIGYCVYTQEISNEANTDLMTNHSAKISADVLKVCVKLRGATDFNKTMNEIMEDIRVLCDARYCCVMLTDFRERTFSLFSESRHMDSDTRPVSTFFDKDFIDCVELWMESIGGSNCLIIKDEQDMEFIKTRNPKWYNSLKMANVTSLVLFPLQSNNEVFGFIWVANFDTDETPRIKETMELSTFFLAAEIANHQLVNQLEILSSVDMLTGVKNRNAMNNLVSRIVMGKIPAPKRFGIVVADVNGLKPVNDNEGHEAGDNLLKRAALVLKDAFEGYDVFRAGGDEFVVVAQDIEKAELEKRVQGLRENSDKPGNVSFALGAWFDDQGGDIRKAMHNADVEMYKDKKLHYEKNPKIERR